ncbi:MAG: hypothetical protein PHO13_01505 [Fermentimonas sp.]|jgi:hypothetical protein|nr:hypothetical protein [Fermentimonas sp.]NLC85855.1 hypothetical protein [Bacteroidales bacterium]HBT85358.1 hypothetical protein [Porphyromonadaceae bacterium]MDD2931393.1 hypothetical protein [Fermentimonas sp.]MDD3188156.1 hypothetical protein [Fermentimonas sp.]
MRNAFSKVIVVFISIFIIQCGSDEKAINKKLSQMAADLNVSAPVMLDQYTRFDFAEVDDDNVFRYNYTVLNSSNPDSLIQIVSANLKENIKREFSTNPQLLFFKENNVRLEYVYKDEGNQVVSLLHINPEDYQ